MPTAAYIGTAAHPVALEWVDTIRVSAEGRYSIQSAPARTWAFVTTGGRASPPRSWDVTLRADNATMANLEGLAAGAFGNGPFLWLPESAYVTNALTPRQAAVMDAPGAGAGVSAVEGWAPRSVLGGASTILAAGVPVLPGEPVTVSVDASGPTILRPIFRNAAGVQVSAPTASASGTGMQRIHFTTGGAPSTARTVDVVAEGFTAVTRPQVTWLRRPTPWAPGAGSAAAVIARVDTTPLYLEGRGDLLTSVTMKIQEVS